MIAPVIPAPTIMTSVSISPTASWLGISGKGAPCQIVCPDRRLRWMTDMAVNQYGEKDPALRWLIGRQFVLVARFSQIEGYRCLSLIRALGVVNCQLALVWLALRSCSQAAISSMRVCLSGMRRSRHWDDRTPSSDSARSSQLPSFGV